jgi:ATP-dependent DNA ligase
MLQEFPAHLRAYDLLVDGDEDLRDRPFAERRERLAAFVARLGDPRVDLSPAIAFAGWDALAAARADPATAGAGADAEAVEGVMLKRRDSVYVPGRPKGPWWKWKRDPFTVDAVLMYAQRGHGKRSSYYSDYTFGVWKTGDNGDELVPVGKAYFGFTDEELKRIDRFVRDNTVERFGPVREVGRTRAWCSRWRSRACSARHGTSPASPCAFRASVGCAGTSPRARPTESRRWRQCFPSSKAGAALPRYRRGLRTRPTTPDYTGPRCGSLPRSWRIAWLKVSIVFSADRRSRS